jgi:hypothetical protein
MAKTKQKTVMEFVKGTASLKARRLTKISEEGHTSDMENFSDPY